MSRIDEALRKAAAEAEDYGQTAVTSAALAAAGLPNDIDELSREALPVEIMERRRHETRTSGGSAKRESTSRTKNPPATFEQIETRAPGKTVIDQEITPESVEQYRRLAATLHNAQSARNIKVVMVTSAVVGEGKTLTSSNLALTLSESYKKHVLLIDADLRRPAIDSIFKINTTLLGLSEGLTALEERRLSVQQVSPLLGILPAGRPISDPIASLTSERMRRLLDEARETFDWVIVDTPPVAMLPDANLLASMVDGAVVVVKAGATPYEFVQRAIDAIGKDRTLGIVLNRSEATHADAYGYYGYYKSTSVATDRDSP